MKMCKICNGWGDSIGDDDRCPRCTKRGYEPTAEYAADRTDRDEAPRATIQVEFTRRKDVVSYRIPGDNNWQSLNQCAPLANAARNLLEPEDNMYCQKCGDLLTYTYSAHGPCMRCESKPEVPEWFGVLRHKIRVAHANGRDVREFDRMADDYKQEWNAVAREAVKFAAGELRKVQLSMERRRSLLVNCREAQELKEEAKEVERRIDELEAAS